MERPESARARDRAGPVHEAVLVDEVLSLLGGEDPAALEGWVVDATLGAGGHARGLLERFPGVRLLGIDQDPEILRHARQALKPFGSRALVRRARASSLARILHEEGISRVVGVLLDLGPSSLQLDSAERGFSFAVDAPLDMRMDSDRPTTAADIVNRWDESDLADLFHFEGGEPQARRVARAIVEGRRRAPFLRTGALVDLIERASGGSARRGTHPATRVFLSLRRAVNEEGDELRAALALSEEWLVDGGRLTVVSFHSGEDGEVKRFLAAGARERRWRLLTRGPVRPTPAEILRNRRARSAVLRAAERTRRGAGQTPGSRRGRR